MQPFKDPQVDAEHDWMITFFDGLRDRSGRIPGDAVVDAQLTRCLLDYLSSHCAREEQLMRAQGYPDADRHMDAHRALQSEFSRLLLPRLQGHLGLDEDLRLVRELFLRHIVSWDETYGEWLARGAARPPT